LPRKNRKLSWESKQKNIGLNKWFFYLWFRKQINFCFSYFLKKRKWAKGGIKMAIEITGRLNAPNATALSTDIVAGKLPGLQPGMVVYFTDTQITQIARSDGVLVDYFLPISFNGTVEIGAVSVDQTVAESTSLSSLYGTQLVAVPGTAEPLVGSANKVIMAVIFAKTTNADNVYVGTAAVDKTSSKQIILRPGATVSIDAPLGYNFNLANWYVDAEMTNDGVDFMAMK
jgi:hypothetical protein